MQVRLGYADRARTETERTVHPLGLVEKHATWYLVAGTAAGLRTFRVNRVRSVVPTGEPVVRPADFDLAATWESVVATVEERRTSQRAVVRVPAYARHTLAGQFGPRTVVRAELADGRVELEVGARTAGMIAEQLAGWGAMVEVVAPQEVRAELARIGRELVASHGAP